MKFESELKFEDYLRGIVLNILPKTKDWIVLKTKRSFDIVICKNGTHPNIYFLEAKYHKEKHGRMATGHGNGNGFQPEVLKTKPDFFEQNLRWILGKENSDLFWVLSNSETAKNLSGDGIEEKYNNIRTSVLRIIRH